MTPLIFLLPLVLTASWTVGVEVMETHHLYGAIGSSVLFPEVNVGNDTVYDLIRGDGAHKGYVVTCHGVCNVRFPYTERGHFFQNNGTFLLNKLRAEDSGTFDYKINLSLKGRIHLRVMAPVKEPVLLKQEAIVNGSQCLVTFTCQAEGDGPFNFTLLRNNNEKIQNVTSLYNSSSLSMDGWHPGIFSCMVANAISFQTSSGIELLPPVTLKEMVIRLIVIAFLCHWFFALCILSKEFIYKKLRKEKQKDEDNTKKTLQSDAHQHRGPEHRDTVNSTDGSHSICPLTKWRCPNHNRSTVDKILCLINRIFTIADNFLGFLKECAVLIICLDGEIIPAECGCVPAFFLLCRVIYWIFFFVNRCRQTNVRFSSAVEVFCNPAMIFSNMVVIPAFCIAILVIITIRYGSPCGTMDISPAVLPVACVLIFIFYSWIKAKVKAKGKAYIQGKEGQPESQHLVDIPNGDIGHPENNNDIGRPENNGDIGQLENNGDMGQPKDNRNPNCEGPVPPGIIGNPNVEQDAPMQCEVFNEGHPEDQMIPKPRDGQLAEAVPCNSHVGAGHCLLTIEKELVVDKGPVSNG
ncbi:uncharacterized protein [Aquarana catesbeiana]|uniref:uncharacterized protein isoform X3 n=1 Tax=Aquarana catesbeiana TaxID=8400 RepID=UPI003CC98019